MKLDPKLEELMKDPVLLIGMCLAGFVILNTPGKARPDVPGLRERRNAAWRGRGSFGKAPFGSQVRHR